MNVLYSVKGTRIKSSWFDLYEGSKYSQLGWKGLNLYFQLYKFKLNTNEHIFVTSLGLLQKVTKYTVVELFNMLLRLKRYGVIDIQNATRSDYMLKESVKLSKCKKDEEGNYIIKKTDIDANKVLIIEATDTPQVHDEVKDDKVIHMPVTQDDRYISINFELFELYKQQGLDEKYYALFCLLNKWNKNVENKSFMSLEKMGDVLGMHHDTVHKMIIEMNRRYLLYSVLRDRKNKEGMKFEHHLAWNMDIVKYFENKYAKEIKRLVGEFDKRRLG